MDITNTWFSKAHPLLIVGYGIERGVEFWIAKNSFGTAWGEKGFIRVKKEDAGVDVLSI